MTQISEDFHTQTLGPRAEELNQIFMMSDDLMGTASLVDGRFIVLNPAWERVTGFSLDELRSKPFIEFVHPDDRARTQAEVERQIREGDGLLFFENRYISRSGGYRLLSWHASVKSQDNTVSFVARDITEQREAVKIHLEAIEHMDVGLFIYRLDKLDDPRSLRLLLVNPAVAALTGADVSDQIGRTMAEIYPGLYETQVPEIYANVVRTGQSVDLGEVPYGDPRVRFSYFRVRAFPLPDQCVGVTFENVTEQHLARQQLDKRFRQLETVAQVSAIVSTVTDIDEVMLFTVELIKEKFGLYHAHIYLLDDAGVDLVLAAGAGEPGRLMKTQGHRIALENPNSLVARAGQSHQVVIVNDVATAPDFLPNPLLPQTRAELSVAMIAGDALIGVLDVQSDQVNYFSPDDVQLYTSLAAGIAISVQSARARRRTEDSERLLRTIIDSTPSWIFAKDKNFRFMLVNRAFAQFYGGLEPEQMIGKDDYDLGTPAYLIEGDPAQGIRGFRTDDREAIFEGKTVYNPYDVVTFRDGSVHILDTIKVPLRNARGEIIGVLGTAHDITERVRASSELERRANELATVAEVSAAASRLLDPDKLLQQVVDLTKERFKLYHAHIYLYDDQKRALVLSAGAGEPGRLMKAQGRRIAISNPNSLVARAARERQGVLVNDVTEAPDFLPNPLLPETRAEMSVPMLFGDQLIGVLDVQSDQVGYFTESDLHTHTALANQLAVAIENARAFREIEIAQFNLRERNKELSALHEISAYAEQEYTLPEYLRRVADRLPASMRYPEDCAVAIELEGAVYGDARALSAERRLEHAINVNQVAVGRLAVGYLTEREFLEEEMPHIRAVAESVETHISTVRAKEEMQKRASELAVVAEVSTIAARILNTRELLTAVSNLTKEKFGLYHAHVYLLNAEGDALVLAGGAGEVGQKMLAEGRTIPLKVQHSLVVQAALTRKGVTVNDVYSDPNFLPNVYLPKTRSEMAIPMIVGDELIGVLDVQSDRIGRFTEIDVNIKTALANQIAVAVQNARRYEQQVAVAEEARKLDRLKSEFLSSMSHELRTPLNSIIGYAEVMLDGVDGDLPDEAMEDVKAIHDSGKHLLSMINDILDLAKIEAQRLELDLERVTLNDVVDEVARMTSILFKDKPVTLALDLAADLPALHADRVRLRQILNNLVSNAVKFTEKGEVRIAATHQPEQGMVQISVKDTGIGIAPEYQTVIFEQFRQVDGSSKRKAGGTGLGLAITRHLVNMHGGRIWVESALGQGSTFSFVIPVHKQD